MRIHLVYDIAPQSTRDVADGLRDALRSAGCEVTITPTHQYVQHLYKPFGDDHSKLAPEIHGMLYGVASKIVLAEAVIANPDVVLVVSGWIMARLVAESIRRTITAKLALYLTESPYQDREQAEQESFGLYDLVFCNEMASLPFLASHANGELVYCPHSYNPEVHRVIPEAVFGAGPGAYMCGTGFSERLAILGAVNWKAAGIDLRLDGFWPRAGALDYAVNNEVIPNASLPLRYREAGINVNIHRTTRTWRENSGEETHIETAQSIGPRVFEVLASGGFLLTDWRDEMNGWLHDGEHIAVFEGPEDFRDKVLHYHARPEERLRIADAGRAAAAGCTFASRVAGTILPAMRRVLKGA